MRLVGPVLKGADPQRFLDGLKTKGIDVRVLDAQFWVGDEDDVADAKLLYRSYCSDPEQPAFQVREEANRLREAERQSIARFGRLKRETPKGPMGGLRGWGPPPVLFLILGSIVVTLVTEFGRNVALTHALQPWPDALARGEWWRVLTPAFLHYSFLHILFNLLWIRQLGSAILNRLGVRGFMLLLLFSQVPSSWLAMTFESPNFGGMSGIVYGLFGFIWTRSHLDPRSGWVADRGMTLIFFGWLVLGFSGLLGLNLSNWGHLGGLVGGGIYACTVTVKNRLRRTHR